MGGTGSVMNVSGKGDILQWKITKTDGTETVIEVNRKNSNQY